MGGPKSQRRRPMKYVIIILVFIAIIVFLGIVAIVGLIRGW
jgi:hypothetical protein